MDNRFENFTISVLRLYKIIKKIKLLEMEEYGLKSVHVMCVYFVAKRKEGVTASELVQRTSEDKAAISRALSQLAAKGYVRYDANKYSAPVALTEKGEELAREIDAKAEAAVFAAGNFLTEADRAVMYSSLERIAENLEEYYRKLNGGKQ